MYTGFTMEYPSKAADMSDAHLLRYSEKHLKYEIIMLFNTGAKLSTVPVSEVGDRFAVTDKNARVESFVTHLRNLLFFLYPYNPAESDVISDHYFVDPIADWKKKRPRLTKEFQEFRDRASQEISHLTVLRRDADKDHEWPVPKIMRDIRSVLRVFVDNASSTKLDSSVKNLVDDSIDLRSRRVIRESGSSASVATLLFATSTTSTSVSEVLHLGVCRLQ